MKWTGGRKKNAEKQLPSLLIINYFLSKNTSLLLSSFWVCRIEFISNDKLVGERSPQLFRSRERRHNFSEFSHRNEIFVVVLRVSSWWWKCGKSQKEKNEMVERKMMKIWLEAFWPFSSLICTQFTPCPPSLPGLCCFWKQRCRHQMTFSCFFLSFTKKIWKLNFHRFVKFPVRSLSSSLSWNVSRTRQRWTSSTMVSYARWDPI